MEATHRGGLCGKARNNRHRRRVERMHAQQMLEEYFGEEEDEIEVRSRHVPVRGRAEFLPTLDSWSRDDQTIETGSQLELTLTAESSPRERASSECLVLAADESASKADVTTCTTDATKPIVIPSPYWARPRPAFQPRGGREAARTFDLRRFAYGCALGSAAAAAILLLVSTVFH